MNVAVVGAGFAGLSVVFHLVNRGVSVTLFDPKGVGGGASGVSTGLLHPFPGKRALRSWMASEGMKATEALLRVSEASLGRPVAAPPGIFRPAISAQQRGDFLARAKEDSEAVWKEIALPGMAPTEGIWLETGRTVYSRLYLKGLWIASEKKGAVLKKEKVESLSDLASFDQIILAGGGEMMQWKEFSRFPLKGTLGQTLLCRWKDPLPFSLVSQGHITPTEEPFFCQVGSTYEHTETPDPKKALELLEKVALFYPPARSFEVIEIRSGLRITQKEGYRPIVKKVGPKVWVFTGLGSRGLLYHGWLGNLLGEAVCAERASLFLD